MTQSDQPTFTVTGGAGGVDAHYEDMDQLARRSEELAGFLASTSAHCHGALVDADVVASAVLDPVGVAKFEQALLGALDGPDGLSALSAGHAARSVALREVVVAYKVTDEAQAKLIDGLRWTVGFMAADNPATTAALLASLGIPIALYTLAGGEIDWERLITDHPGIVDNLVGAGPGLLSGLGIPVFGVPSAANLIADFYPDGNPQVNELGADPDARMTAPPTGFGDLIAGLDYRNGESHANQPDQIDVRIVTQPDGSKAYIVDIPGTKVWDMPGQFSPYLNDLGTNVHVLGGDVTARERAIALALQQAGASPTDPVMLVGHSQGGMVAAQAAHDSTNGTFNYNITHVVTAGSPIGRTEIPPNVQVLSLENSHDVVPHLDATDNPDRPNRTTVTFNDQNGSIGDNHGTKQAYLPAARALDNSTDPSVQAFRDSAGAFLNGSQGGKVDVKVYELNRVP